LAMKNFVIERNAKRVLKIYERYTQQPANPIIPELGM
jgi:hypothetical protein